MDNKPSMASEVRLATILFADIRNSAQISNVLSLREYDTFISQFQGAMRRVLDEQLSRHYSPEEFCQIDTGVRGDEACLIIYRARTPADVERDIEVALHIAFRMKREWLLIDFNRRRLMEGKMIEDIGVGINVGEIVVGEHAGRPGQITPEGWAINFAKKVEGTSREAFYSKIMVSQAVHQVARRPSMGVSFADRQIVDFPGIARRMPVYEVKCFELRGEHERRALTKEEMLVFSRALHNNPYDLWLSIIYGNGLYAEGHDDKAIEAYRNAISIEPEYPVAYFNIALCYYRQGLLSQASEHVDMALERSPGYAQAHYLKGLICGQRGDLTAEIAGYEKALEYDPTYRPALVNLCEVLLLEGKTQAARARINAARSTVDDPAVQMLLTFLAALAAALDGADNIFAEYETLARQLTGCQFQAESISFDFSDSLALAEKKLPADIVERLRALAGRIGSATQSAVQ